MYEINIPQNVCKIIETLEQNGYEAFVVGGCVRDSLLGLPPKDWDICTSATPDEVKNCMNCKTIDTGIKHGTVTVVVDNTAYEVTTYRVEGGYTDSRHPDTVWFVTDIEQDLSRRDFTINAMAYNPKMGLVDPHGGMADLQNKIISCVGNPDERFSEDALRILRALRFASVYGFEIDTETANAIHRNKDKLNNIARERVRSELTQIIDKGDKRLDILLKFSDVIAVIIPEIKSCIGFDQNNKYHKYTIYEHMIRALCNYNGSDMSVKIALLVHDIGKPYCYTEDENGGHFYGHANPSSCETALVLDRLRFDNKTQHEVFELVLYHDACIAPTYKTVRKWLNKIGERRFKQLIQVKLADIKAHGDVGGDTPARIDRCNLLNSMIDTVVAEEQCFKIRDLNINGNDIMKLGVNEGIIVGDTLKHLLDRVINGDIENTKSALTKEAESYIKDKGVKLND